MRIIIILVYFSLFIGCAAIEKAEIPDRALRCDAIEMSLKEDLYVAGSGAGVGIKVVVDRANSVSEQNLVALQAMLAHCRLWARDSISNKEYSDRVAEHAGVYSAYLSIASIEKTQQEQFEVIKLRIDGLAEAFQSSNIIIDNEKLKMEEEYAKNLVRDNNTDRSVEELKRRLQSLQLQYEEDSKSLLGQFVREKEIARLDIQMDLFRSEIIELQNVVVSLKKDSTGLSPTSGALVESIYFENISWKLSDAMIARIESFSKKISPNKYVIKIIGFSDKVGNSNSNLILSKNRARAVSDYMKNKGFNVLNYDGYGSAILLSTTDLENRRVIIEAYRIN